MQIFGVKNLMYFVYGKGKNLIFLFKKDLLEKKYHKYIV